MKTYLYPILIFIILSSLSYIKETRGITPLRDGFSNEPLIVFSEKYPQIFKNDDYWAYTPFPYIPLHKILLKILWYNPDKYRSTYRLWLSTVVFLTSLSLFAWFRYLSKSIFLSSILTVACIVGYFENYWMFVRCGFKDINISARNNFGIFIPIYLLFFSKWINNDKKILLFFFLLGIGVNLYPAIAIGSCFVFILSFLIFKKFSKNSLIIAFIGGILFLIGALPFIIQANFLLQEYEKAHLMSKQYYELLNRINEALTEDVIKKYKSLLWSSGKFNPQGNWLGLFRWFILYPPVMILFLIFALSLFTEKFLNKELSSTVEQNNILKILVFSTTFFIMIGWIKHHFEINMGPLENKLPRLQYLGNFFFFLMYGYIIVFLQQLTHINFSIGPSINKILKYIIYSIGLIFLLQMIISFIAPKENFLHDTFIVNNIPWILALLIIGWCIVMSNNSKLISSYLITIIVFAVASGFSFDYDEYKLHYPYFSKMGVYISYILILISAFIFLRISIIKMETLYNFKNVIFLVLLSLIPFSWRLPIRAYNNILLIIGKQPAYFAERFEKEPVFHEMTKWVKKSTPLSSRFLILNNVSALKAFALRSTPLLDGGEYEYFGDKGRIYAKRNSELYKEALEQNDFEKLVKLARELKVDYAIVNKANYPLVNFNKKYLIFNNKYYKIYNLRMEGLNNE